MYSQVSCHLKVSSMQEAEGLNVGPLSASGGTGGTKRIQIPSLKFKRNFLPLAEERAGGKNKDEKGS